MAEYFVEKKGKYACPECYNRFDNPKLAKLTSSPVSRFLVCPICFSDKILEILSEPQSDSKTEPGEDET